MKRVTQPKDWESQQREAARAILEHPEDYLPVQVEWARSLLGTDWDRFKLTPSGDAA